MLPFRLPAKFLVLVLGIIAVFFGMFSVFVIQRETHILARKSAEKENLLSRTIVADLKDSMLSGRPRSTLNLIESLQGAHGLERLAVLRRDGTSAFGGLAPRITLPQVRTAFESGRELDFTEPGQLPVHTSLFPLKNGAECRRCHARAGDVLGVVIISHSLEDTIGEIREGKRHLIMLLTALIAVMGAALYVVVRKVVLTPLRALHRGAEIIGKGDLAHRISVASRDEFHDLADAFNDMAGRVKETHAGLENLVKVRTAELSEGARLMRGILSSMSSGVVLLGRDGRVKLINRQGAWILGRGHEDLVGRDLTAVVPETTAFLNVRVGSYEEITVRTTDDATVPVGFTSSYFSGGDGEQEGFIIVYQDLTEIKSLHAELLSKERFASMGRVVAGVAHEIRNPLFGISAIGQIFERDLKDPAHHELASALLGETKRLNHLVEELLIYGRPMRLKREEADLRILWEEVLDLHRAELRQRGIKVTGDYAVRHPLATFDSHQIRQVFLNLLMNAMEATPDGGAINITMLLEDRYILFRVADTGAGIPPQHRANVFDLFYTTKPKGTGLGLAICRKIMQDHGGDIALASTEGVGTTVTIRLPFSSAPDAETGPR